MENALVEEDISNIFDLQKRHLNAVRATTAAERIAKLEKLRSVIHAHMFEAIAALDADLGKPPFEAVIDIGAAFSEIDEVSANLEKWMQPSSVQPGRYAAPGAAAEIIHEPRGRILIFGPWNFPFGLLFQPLIGAIAAGNVVIAKPSEMAPATSAISAKIIREAFPAHEAAVIEGGPDIATALLDLPFDHIFFTGSTKVGKLVQAAAGKHLATLTLELGGKCPAIIDSGADLKMSAGRIAWGKYLNAGQICLAPDHVWVKPAERDAFAIEVAAYLRNSYYQDGKLNQRDLARIVDQRNHSRLKSLLQDAVARGARIISGGHSEGLHFEPTVLVDVPRDSAIMQEEIFGPILPILTYDSVEDLTDELNNRDKPLALYLFSANPDFVNRIVQSTSSGGVTVNDVIQHAGDIGLPFGGVGASGMGAYHGFYSFLEMSHARSIYRQAAVNPAETYLRPPYNDRMPG